jgi:hypothetical protein
VRDSGKRVISSLNRQLEVFTTTEGSSKERSVFKQAQDNKEGEFSGEVLHGSNLARSGWKVMISIT